MISLIRFWSLIRARSIRLMSHLLDQRFGLKQRLAATLASMIGAPQRLMAKDPVLLSPIGFTLLELGDGSRAEL